VYAIDDLGFHIIENTYELPSGSTELYPTSLILDIYEDLFDLDILSYIILNDEEHLFYKIINDTKMMLYICVKNNVIKSKEINVVLTK